MATAQQGSPIITKADMVAYWDFLSRKHVEISKNTAQKYKQTVTVPLGAVGDASVFIGTEKIMHFFRGHTFKHFNVSKGNFSRSSTGQMGFWPRTKKKSDIINDAVTALINNATVVQLLSQDTNAWKIDDTHASKQVSTIDVDVPYPLHLGFYRTGVKSFNLTQLYPNFNAAGGTDTIIMHESMVIAMFSPLLPLEWCAAVLLTPGISRLIRAPGENHVKQAKVDL